MHISASEDSYDQRFNIFIQHNFYNTIVFSLFNFQTLRQRQKQITLKSLFDTIFMFLNLNELSQTVFVKVTR